MASSEDKSPAARVIDGLLDPWRLLGKFRRTRRAIRNGEELYNYSAERFGTLGYMGPWSFNIFESAIVSIPIIILIELQDFFSIEEIPIKPGTYNEYVLFFTEKTAQILYALAVPFLFTFFVHSLAWASLKRNDQSSENRLRARKAYLYFDGAYGLIAQALLVLWVLVGKKTNVLEIQEPVIDNLWIAFLFVTWALILYNYYILGEIADKLFSTNGYPGEKAYWFWQKKPEDYPPEARYWLVYYFCGAPTAFIVYFLLGHFATLIGTVLAYIRTQTFL